jgi:hypothetical protein
LKHTAFRIWAATAISVPGSLWILSLLDHDGGLLTPLLLLAVFFVLCFAVSGWLGVKLALGLLPSILHEAGVYERNGEPQKAESAYRKALALYESYLMSPGARRRGIATLVSRMARLYAAQTERQAAADQFMDVYLENYPADHEIAENWLQTREYQGGLAPHQQDLAARIGQAHADNISIQTRLARLYLLGKRTDFPALQTYRRVMATPESKSSNMAMDLANVFIDEGRSDEWALPVYLRAAAQQPAWETLRCGIAACLRWIRPSDGNADLLEQAHAILGSTDEETLRRMSSGFVPPSGSFTLQDTPQIKEDVDPDRPRKVALRLREVGSHIHRLRQDLRGKIVDRMRRSAGLRRTLTWGLIAGLGTLATIFTINTVGYLTPSPVPEPAPLPVQPTVEKPPPPMPYTLQVAAYLKPEHAEDYIKSLRKQSVDAYLVKARGNDKTWYQVRVAQFPDKAAARTFGSNLKAEGLIEDFYVARNQKP